MCVQKERLYCKGCKSLFINPFRISHSIRKLQMNLMNLRFQFVVCNLFIFRLFLDQGLNIFIQAYYNDIGKEKAFHIWWLAFYLEDIGKI